VVPRCHGAMSTWQESSPDYNTFAHQGRHANITTFRALVFIEFLVQILGSLRRVNDQGIRPYVRRQKALILYTPDSFNFTVSVRVCPQPCELV